MDFHIIDRIDADEFLYPIGEGTKWFDRMNGSRNSRHCQGVSALIAANVHCHGPGNCRQQVRDKRQLLQFVPPEEIDMPILGV